MKPELKKAIQDIRNHDSGAWLKECSSVSNCKEGTKARQKMARLLDELYKVSGVTK